MVPTTSMSKKYDSKNKKIARYFLISLKVFPRRLILLTITLGSRSTQYFCFTFLNMGIVKLNHHNAVIKKAIRLATVTDNGIKPICDKIITAIQNTNVITLPTYPRA